MNADPAAVPWPQDALADVSPVIAPVAPTAGGPVVLDLPRLVLRRAAVVALLALAAAVALGWYGAARDVDEEVAAARGLVAVLQTLNEAALPHAAPVSQTLAALQASASLRHLRLQVLDAQGRILWASAPEVPPGWAMRWAMALHRQWQALPEARTLRWQLPRGDEHWTVLAHVSSDSERREALADMARLLGVLVLGLLVLWLGLRRGTRRAFEPLAELVHAIEGMGPRGGQALARLPKMPIRELAAITQALQHLAADLDQSQAQRRLLSQKVLSVQEDERNHLARELHDEMGQRLTALRLDIAWLSRQLQAQPHLQAVVQAMSERCQEAQMDLRAVLGSLRPLGPGAAGADIPLARLLQLLQDLVGAWRSGAAAQDQQVLQPVLHLTQCDDTHAHDCGALTQLRPLTSALAATLHLAPALALALYRLSQEGLTNVARHAHARRADLRLTLHCQAGLPCRLDWELVDDGVGLPTQADALQRGNGLGGMQERVWALGGEWCCEPAAAPPRPGLRLRARLPWSGVVT